MLGWGGWEGGGGITCEEKKNAANTQQAARIWRASSRSAWKAQAYPRHTVDGGEGSGRREEGGRDGGRDVGREGWGVRGGRETTFP